jgi:P pilus assembly chaperone PapD
MKKIVSVIFVLLCFCGAQSFAAEEPMPMLDVSSTTTGGKNLVFDKDSKKSQYITVKNIGKAKGYVAINVYDPLESRVGQNQQDTLKKSFKMIISPRRMILKPNQSKRIRVTDLTGKVEKERVVDIVVNLVKPYNNSQKNDVPEGAMGIAVKGSIIHVVQVHVMPSNLEPSLSHKIVTTDGDQKAIQFSNDGNITLTLVNGEACKTSDDCDSLTSFRIYPGQEKTVSIPSGYENAKITYTQKAASGNSEINITE